MKHIFKLTSLLLCMLILMTSVISCASTESQTTTDSTAETTSADTTEAPETTEADTTEAPETDAPKVPEASLPELTVEELTEGFVDGEYTLDESPVLSKELLTALHRMTGEEKYEELVPIESMEDTWYKDAVLWAVNNSIANFEFTYCSINPSSGRFCGFFGEGDTYDAYLRCIDDPDASPGLITFSIGSDAKGADTEITRSDAVLAFFRFTEKVLKMETGSDGDISDYADNEKFPKKSTKYPEADNDRRNSSHLFSTAHKMYNNSLDIIDLYDVDGLTKIWLWALDVGIVEAYPDNTLRPDATLTRAEFAVMLERFMDYVK